MGNETGKSTKILYDENEVNAFRIRAYEEGEITGYRNGRTDGFNEGYLSGTKDALLEVNKASMQHLCNVEEELNRIYPKEETEDNIDSEESEEEIIEDEKISKEVKKEIGLNEINTE